MPMGPVEVVSRFFDRERRREGVIEPDGLAMFEFEIAELRYWI